MRKADFDRRFAVLVEHYVEVAAAIDIPPTLQKRKASYRAILDEFMARRNYTQVARAFDVVRFNRLERRDRAIRIAENLEPPPESAKSKTVLRFVRRPRR